MGLFTNTSLLSYDQGVRRLRYLAIGLLLLLLVPLGVLLYFADQQMQQNLLAEYQREANSLVQSTNRNLFKRRLLTNSLPTDAFYYYQQVYNPLTGLSQQALSPLSRLEFFQPKISQQMQGLVGFFQYNLQGEFNSPVWPYPISPARIGQTDTRVKTLTPELQLRKQTAFEIYQLLAGSESLQQLVQQNSIEEHRLFGVLFDLPQHFIFYRVALVNEQQHLQGYLVERQPYLSQLLADTLEQAHFDNTMLIQLRDDKHPSQREYFLYQNSVDGQVVLTQPIKAEPQLLQQSILQTRLRWPFDSYAVEFSSQFVPVTASMWYSRIFIGGLIMAILFACYGFYRLGLKHLALAEQRMNFVSAVSHELKTPLTSIRMYAEMLKSGTVISPQHQRDYYEFIYGESERLTRLINNILQLSKLGHQQQSVNGEYVPLMQLVDTIRSKTSTILEKHQFQQHIQIDVERAENVQLWVDKDAFSQVIINITDNAVKFFDSQKINDSSRQRVDFIFRLAVNSKDCIQLEIRDYGEGISPEQQDKIFELFYRGGNELTRTTQGTGIGLALVNELVQAQQGQIQVVRKQPGLAMLLCFQCQLSE